MNSTKSCPNWIAND